MRRCFSRCCPQQVFRVKGSNLALIPFAVNGIEDRRLQLRGLAVLIPGGVTSRLITGQFSGREAVVMSRFPAPMSNTLVTAG
jgi:hypothetical protein